MNRIDSHPTPTMVEIKFQSIDGTEYAHESIRATSNLMEYNEDNSVNPLKLLSATDESESYLKVSKTDVSNEISLGLDDKKNLFQCPTAEVIIIDK